MVPEAFLLKSTQHIRIGLASLSSLKPRSKSEMEVINYTSTQLRKGKALKKHSLHKENSSFGFIEAVHQQ